MLVDEIRLLDGLQLANILCCVLYLEGYALLEKINLTHYFLTCNSQME